MHLARQSLPLLAAVAVPFAAGELSAGVVFEQDFSSSSTVGDYVSATPDSGQFHTIGTTPGGSASITGSALLLAQDGQTSGSSAGFLRAEVTNTPGLLSFQADITVDRVADGSDFQDYARIHFGDRSPTDNYNVFPHDNSWFARVLIKGRGGYNSGFRVETETSQYNFGEAITLRVFMNDSGSAQTYVGPDGQTHNLSATPTMDSQSNAYVQGSYALWVNNQVLIDNAAAGTFTHVNGHNANGVLDTFWINWLGPPLTSSIAFDNIVVRDDLGLIPEPASLALLLAGVGLIGLRRRV